MLLGASPVHPTTNVTAPNAASLNIFITNLEFSGVGLIDRDERVRTQVLVIGRLGVAERGTSTETAISCEECPVSAGCKWRSDHQSNDR
jgi:hypothetical protein